MEDEIEDLRFEELSLELDVSEYPEFKNEKDISEISDIMDIPEIPEMYQGEEGIDFILRNDESLNAYNEEGMEEYKQMRKKLKVTQKELFAFSEKYEYVMCNEEDEPVVLNNYDEKIPFFDNISARVSENIFTSPIPVYFTEEEKRILTEENLKLTYYMASKYSNYKRIEFEDLVGYANIGFVNALNTYDKRLIHRINFTTYCCNCIDNAIKNKIDSENRKLDTFAPGVIRLDQGVSEGNNYSNNGEYSKSRNMMSDIFGTDVVGQVKSAEDVVVHKYKIKALFECINELSERDRFMICSTYGCFSYEYMKQSDIAKMLGVSQCSISKHIDVLKRKLKVKLTSKYNITRY